ncbi:MAG TPA: lytic transglycosylase domain-containing protein [Steroidobacteraceae bacterium]|nr:lytic transglycosylase domain-containing protein [Steroidobacteraceae bacterium]
MSASSQADSWRVALRAALTLALALTIGAPTVLADRQLDPELKAVVAEAIKAGECFPDKYEAEVWYKLMEPRLRRYVKNHAERVEILKHTYCESRQVQLPAELVLAVMDVESSFNRWAVSSAGAQGLMQVMPFWPEELGMKRHQLMQVQPNIRMGCAILKYYYDREKRDVRRALARYNGSVGRREYPDLVITRWTSRWRS